MVTVINFNQNLIISESSHYEEHKPLWIGDLLEPMTRALACIGFFLAEQFLLIFIAVMCCSHLMAVWIQENMETPTPLICNRYNVPLISKERTHIPE